MKYHGHEIKRIQADLGEDRTSKNCLYEIYKDDKRIATALTASTAKEYIDSGYNEIYL